MKNLTPNIYNYTLEYSLKIQVPTNERIHCEIYEMKRFLYNVDSKS